MTMPHLMNCQHSGDGWCLDCVKELYDTRFSQSEDERIACDHIAGLLGSSLFTIQEDGDVRSVGRRGVGVTWKIWRSIKVIVRAYLREHQKGGE